MGRRRSKPVKATAAEKRIIDARLQKKYPQMWELAGTARDKRLLRGMSASDRRALEVMVGKKLKAVYGGRKKKRLTIPRSK